MLKNSSLYNKSVIALIIFISAVAISYLFWIIYFKTPVTTQEILNYPYWVNDLASLNALLNFCSATALILGFISIKRKHQKLHQLCMMSAFFFSALFLVSYITYHHYHGDSHFVGTGILRGIYFFILVTHIFLSIICLPLVLTTFYFALSQQWLHHRRLARWTFPMWLYVSVTGVLVYFFLRLSAPL